MKDNQHITVPRNDTRRVEISLTDTSGENAGGPTNLQSKTVRWALKKHANADTPVIEYTTADAPLTIEDAVGGIASLVLDSDETRPEYDNYRHFWYVDDGTDQWTVATGLLKID